MGETVWGVVSANMSVVTGLLGAVLGVILGFGMDFINFIIEMV